MFMMQQLRQDDVQRWSASCILHLNDVRAQAKVSVNVDVGSQNDIHIAVRSMSTKIWAAAAIVQVQDVVRTLVGAHATDQDTCPLGFSLFDVDGLPWGQFYASADTAPLAVSYTERIFPFPLNAKLCL